MHRREKSDNKMTESLEGNGEFNSYDEETDFKRGKGGNSGNQNESDEPQNEQPSINEKAQEYIRDCMTEKSKLDKGMPIAERLLSAEIEVCSRTGRIPSRDPKYVDIYREKPIRVAQKVLVPIREHPKFNFVGKLLGPKGNSLRRLQEETLCKMTVLGRNSMKDRAKEEELRNSMDPKYSHLNDDLHVEISTIAPPAEAHARMAYAMAELRKYLIPDSNDIIRQEQLRELMDSQAQDEIGPDGEKMNSGPPYKQRPPPPSGGPGGPRSYGPGGYRGPPPPSGGPSHLPNPVRNNLPPKQKVMSILDRARSAIDDGGYSRHYEDPAGYEPPAYESYGGYGHAPPSSRAPPYEGPDYESTEYRRDYYPNSSYSDNAIKHPKQKAQQSVNASNKNHIQYQNSANGSTTNTNYRTHVNR